MEINRRTDYAIRMLVELARYAPGTRLSVRDLGRLAEVPHPFARAIAQELAQMGFLDSRRGAGGGMRLARPADELTLLDVVVAMQGEIKLNLCTRDPMLCGRSRHCPAHETWNDVNRLLSSFLASRTLSSLAASLPPQPPTPDRAAEAGGRAVRAEAGARSGSGR